MKQKITKEYVSQKSPYPCSATVKSTGRKCKNSAWSFHEGKYYCGLHCPYPQEHIKELPGGKHIKP